MDADGDFVVVWTQLRPGRRRRRHLRPALRLERAWRRAPSSRSTPTPRATSSTAAVAMDADGDFVVVWQSYGQDGSGYGVFAQRFNARGAPLGDEFQVNSYTTDRQYVPGGRDGRRRRLRRRLDQLRPGRPGTRRLRAALPSVGRPRGRRVPGQHLHRRLPARRCRVPERPVAIGRGRRLRRGLDQLPTG